MSQQIKVQRSIDFQGKGNYAPNINGNFDPVKKYVSYDFTELALDTTNKYTQYVDTTSTLALASGGVTLTTAATDTKTCSVACGGIWWYPTKNCVTEMRFQLDVVTTVAINAGFTDAVSEGSGALPFLISGTTIADTATNGAMFCFDTNQTTDYWYIVQTKAGTQTGTLLPSTCAPVAATDQTIRVAINTSGNATYYYNGMPVGYIASATTAATPLVPYFGIRNNAGVAHVATLKYVRCWQDM